MEHRRLDRSAIKVVRPDYHQLLVFLKTVQAGSFSAAARLLGKTQPAVSQAIARLEEIYGGDLFERRRGAPLTLTPIGEAILPSARIILDTVDRQMVNAVAAAQGRIGRVTVGFSCGLAAGPLRAGLAEFVAASPEVELRMTEAPPSALYRQLTQHAVDLVISPGLPIVPSKILKQERLWQERLIVATPKHRPGDRRSDNGLPKWRSGCPHRRPRDKPWLRTTSTTRRCSPAHDRESCARLAGASPARRPRRPAGCGQRGYR